MTRNKVYQLKVGSKFKIKNKEFVVVKSFKPYSCKGCYFNENQKFDCDKLCYNRPYCMPIDRTGGESVIFKEVENG